MDIRKMRLENAAHTPTLLRLTLICFLASVLMALGMSEVPGTYDEGIVLTAGMRIVAGQVPHQDFYVNYGPAGLYTLAGFFKVFGATLLIERVLFSLIAGLILTAVYGITASYCCRRTTQWTTLATFLWLFGLNSVSGSMMYPVSLLNLVIAALLLPVFVQRLSIQRLLAAGLLTGLSELFRYDTGIALVGVEACVIAFAIFFRLEGNASRLREFGATLGIYLLGFFVLPVPALLYYLSVAKWSAFAQDILVYPSKYYHRARNLPMPGIHLKSLDNIAVYLPLVVAAISLYVGVTGCIRAYKTHADAPREWGIKWHGLLVSFGLLSLIMYLKGLVRASPPQMYLSILPALVLIALLYDRRHTFTTRAARALQGLMVLSIVTSVLVAAREVRTLHKLHAWVAPEMIAQARGKLPQIEGVWCSTPSPLTIGHCFLPDDDRIQTIEFIRKHTQPTEKLFVGTTRHDIIFANDNIIYFATQRLPVTHWSHFDPYLQNRLDIQKTMIGEFEAGPPPYIVLDAEFDKNEEPNDSTKSTGVMLLDDYLQSHYRPLEKHGLLSIWKRIGPTT